jgi:hypothetical protein
MDEPTRRAWSKPELIVLVRGGPEEAVLQTCKIALRTPGGTGGYYTGCNLDLDPGSGVNCSWCSTQAAS